MLKHLHIRNFKIWEDTGEIKMAPITLFFGTNSSGKSSIGQFLMMLKQTVESSDRKMIFNTGSKNSAVQLGSYKEMVSHRDVERKISFSYKWELTHPFEINMKDQLKSETFRGNTLEFGAVVGSVKNEKNPVVEKIHYCLSDDEKTSFDVSLELKKKNGKRVYEIYSERFDWKSSRIKDLPVTNTLRFYGFPDEITAYYQNSDFTKDLNLEHENFFKSIFYLAPMRNRAERLYQWSGITPESVGFYGENTISAILSAGKRRFGIVKQGNKKASTEISFEAAIAGSLNKMDLIDSFEVKPIGENRDDYEVVIKTKCSGDEVSLPDTGFGLAQVLPVLVQCFYVPSDSTLIIEQPEIHLHPAAQAALADVMIDAVKAKENGKKRNIQLIIETHSEHFLRRLQRRIAENVVSEKEVAIYFADSEQNPAKLKPLQVDEYGYIKNWPSGFFGDEMGDITEHSKAALEKRMRKQQAGSGER